ncbi:unnamed protein product [Closterium sp. Yama58-4]|nr:unnamed protein product [Closterium sp. Yama58-4]
MFKHPTNCSRFCIGRRGYHQGGDGNIGAAEIRQPALHNRAVDGNAAEERADPAWVELGCDRDGICVMDHKGQLSCLYSPCDDCPSGATCMTFPDEFKDEKRIPYCACPQGYGITPTKCVKGGTSTVSSTSYTLIVDRRAPGDASQPYTFRPNLNASTQYPEAVRGKYTTLYSVENTEDAPRCQHYKFYSADNCAGDPADEIDNSNSPFYLYYFEDNPVPFSKYTFRSVMCSTE